MLRPLAACLLTTAMLFAAGCGDDEEKSSGSGSGSGSGTQSAEAKPLKDVEPRTSKPNITGGDAPIEEFAQRSANDASSYWEQVFTNSNIPYAKPTTTVATAATETCTGPFDPALNSYAVCASESGSTITYGAGKLDALRTSAGDAGMAFLVGFTVSADAHDQLSGRRLAKGQKPDAEFFRMAACFTGAWIKNLSNRQLLEAGDDQEVLALAASYVNQDPAVGQNAVKTGFQGGTSACQGGGGGSEPAPEPTPEPEPAPGPGE